MSREDEEPLPEDWTKAVKTYLDLPTGETTLQLTGEPYLRKGRFGIRLHVPTNLGIWAMNVEGKIANELAKWTRKVGQLAQSTVTVVRTGQGRDTRYDIKHFAPATPDQPAPQPPPNQTMLSVTPEEKQAIQKMRTQKAQQQ